MRRHGPPRWVRGLQAQAGLAPLEQPHYTAFWGGDPIDFQSFVSNYTSCTLQLFGEDFSTWSTE